MNYFNIIEDYKKDRLSPSEHQAFEDELKENSKLHDALEGTKLLDSLLQLAVSEKPGMVQKPQSVQYFRKWGVSIVAFLSLSLMVWLAYAYWDKDRNNSEKPDIHNEQLQKETIAQAPESFDVKPEITLSTENTQIVEKSLVTADRIVEPKIVLNSKNIIEPEIVLNSTQIAQSSEMKGKNSIDNEKFALAEEISLSDTVKSGEQLIVHAGKSILLKPGFKAEAGALFTATTMDSKVESKN